MTFSPSHASGHLSCLFFPGSPASAVSSAPPRGPGPGVDGQCCRKEASLGDRLAPHIYMIPCTAFPPAGGSARTVSSRAGPRTTSLEASGAGLHGDALASSVSLLCGGQKCLLPRLVLALQPSLHQAFVSRPLSTDSEQASGRRYRPAGPLSRTESPQSCGFWDLRPWASSHTVPLLQ